MKKKLFLLAALGLLFGSARADDKQKFISMFFFKKDATNCIVDDYIRHPATYATQIKNDDFITLHKICNFSSISVARSLAIPSKTINVSNNSGCSFSSCFHISFHFLETTVP